MTKTSRKRLILLGTTSVFALAMAVVPVQFSSTMPDLAIAQAAGGGGGSGSGDAASGRDNTSVDAGGAGGSGGAGQSSESEEGPGGGETGSTPAGDHGTPTL